MDLCYFCDAPVHTGLCEPLHTVKINTDKIDCNWCSDPALYSIECASWTDYACTAHAHEWFPHAFKINKQGE